SALGLEAKIIHEWRRQRGTTASRIRCARPAHPRAAGPPRHSRGGVKSFPSAVHAGLYISLNQCSYEPGLGTSSGRRDRLASDEPKTSLTSPT
ncbi:MAG TPA: hypothetical protein PLY54_11870, partial [Ottowia sp.]|nr:hypothetical protein [Ottowia sp.]